MANEALLNENLLGSHEPSPETPAAASAAIWKSNWTILQLAMSLLVVYLVIGVLTYLLCQNQFSGTKTNCFVDALYFSIVTLCTVGYGDIVPSTSATKILTIILVSIGVIFLDYFLNTVVNHVLSLQENAILARIMTRNRAFRDHIAKDGKIRLEYKLGLAFLGVGVYIGFGASFVHVFERLDWLDSVYLSVISVTTVGYGDKAFNTLKGRIFAVLWLLLSTIAMACLFIYIAEMRIDRSTVMKLPARVCCVQAKESGKISEDDIKRIVSEFENREKMKKSEQAAHNNLSNIASPQLLPGN